MQALERVVLSKDFITILLVIAIAFLAMLTSLNAKKLKGNVFAVFNSVFVEEETEENDSFFTLFNLILVIFSALVVSLTAYKLSSHFSTKFTVGILSYLQLFLIVLGYVLLKWFLEFLIQTLFLAKSKIALFLVAKSRSLYSISFGFLGILLLTIYGGMSVNLCLYASALLLVLRFFALLTINKKLILSKLFYFILYLCTFEIAPLFVLFKWIF